MEIAAYNFLLGLLSSEPLRWIPKSLLGSVVRPTSLWHQSRCQARFLGWSSGNIQAMKNSASKHPGPW